LLGKLVGQIELPVAVQLLLGVDNEPCASHAAQGLFVALGWVPYIVAVVGHGLAIPGAIDPAAAVPVADTAGDEGSYILGPAM